MWKLYKIKNRLREIFSLVIGEEVDIVISIPRIRDIDAHLAISLFPIYKKFKINSANFEREILEELKREDYIEKVIFLNNFCNLVLKERVFIEGIKVLFDSSYDFFSYPDKNKSILIEYISANPTGPLNVANARAACVGDLLVESYKMCGFRAYSEYYYNDCGRQVELLGISLRERLKEIEGRDFAIPEDGYHGEYLKELARDYIKEGSREDFAVYAVRKIIEMQKSTLKRFRTYFDYYIKESEIRNKGVIEEVINMLNNYIYEKDGAIYFKSTEFGDEKDRVIVKSTGEYTYFLVDIAYHLDKIHRRFDFLLNLWGPDHHGYINRMKGALRAIGFKNFDVLIVQQVNLKRGKELVRMSKRRGEIYSLDDLIEEVGVDAARFFLLLRAPSTPLDFDITLTKKLSYENPLYYVQYVYARSNQVEKFALNKGFNVEKREDFTLDLAEMELVKRIYLMQDIFEKIIRGYNVHFLPYELLEISKSYHSFYQRERIVDEVDRDRTLKRLFINRCIKNLIGFCLDKMRVTAPEEM